jgi:hypothetical protein
MVTTAVFDVTWPLVVVEVLVTLVLVLFVCSATAVMLTWPLFVVGTDAGARYTPICSSVLRETIVPTVSLPPTIPFTSQVTTVLTVEVVVVFVRFTVAVNSVVSPMPTDALVGVIEIEEIKMAPFPPQPETQARQTSVTQAQLKAENALELFRRRDRIRLYTRNI